MSRMLFISLVTASIGVTGCQDAKFSSNKQATASAAPAPVVPGQPVRPLPALPPAGFPTDDYGGTIRQPSVPPVVYVPPPITQRPPPPPPIPDIPVRPNPPPPPIPDIPVRPNPPPPPIPDVPVRPNPPPPPPPIPDTPVRPNPPAPVPPAPPVPVPPAIDIIKDPIAQPVPPPPPAPSPIQPDPSIPPGIREPITLPEPPIPTPGPGDTTWSDPQPIPPPPPCLDPNGCGTQIAPPAPPLPQEDCRENQACEPPEPVKGQCTAPLNVQKDRTKLDILFVVDASASLLRAGKGSREDGELVQIAKGMHHFVKNLQPETDYRIGVMVGYGDERVGKLFSAGSGDPAVIDYKSLKRDGYSRAQAEKELGRVMERKMRGIREETDGAQGEAMMLNLYKSIVDGTNRERIVRQGLFRKDAALAVVFVSDEQDVCFDYSTASEQIRNNRALKLKRNAQGVMARMIDPNEEGFFNRVCAKAAGGKPLTPGHVYDALLSLKQEREKIMVNVIGYIKPIAETLDVENKPEDENEQAWGMIDLHTLAGNGQLAEMANVVKHKSQFSTELNQIGQYTDFKMRIDHSYICKSNVDPRAINFTSMQVKILNAQGQQIATFFGGCKDGACPEGIAGPAYQEIMTDTRGNDTRYTRVNVPADTLRAILEQHKVTEGRVEMEFMTKSDINPANGEKWHARDLRPKTQAQPRAAQAQPTAGQETAF